MEQWDAFRPLFSIGMLAAVGLVLVVIVPLGYSLFRRNGSITPKSEHDPETPMELLSELYESGKISKKEFDDVKHDLELYVAGKKSRDEFEAVKHELEHHAEASTHHLNKT